MDDLKNPVKRRHLARDGRKESRCGGQYCPLGISLHEGSPLSLPLLPDFLEYGVQVLNYDEQSPGSEHLLQGSPYMILSLGSAQFRKVADAARGLQACFLRRGTEDPQQEIEK